MSILKHYAKGIRDAALRPKMALLLWLVTGAFGLLTFLLVWRSLSVAFGRSSAAGKLFQEFDFLYITEYLIHNGRDLFNILLASAAAAAAYAAVWLFLKGGILFTLLQRQRLASAELSRMKLGPTFFQGAGKFFGRFVRLAVISLLLWIPLAILYFLFQVAGRALSRSGDLEMVAFIHFWVQAGIGVFMVFLGKMVLDYAEIDLVTSDSRKVFKVFLQAAHFVLKKFWKAAGLYALFLVTLGLFRAGLWAGVRALPHTEKWGLLLIFLLQQVFILIFVWLKVGLQAAQISLADAERRPYWDRKLF